MESLERRHCLSGLTFVPGDSPALDDGVIVRAMQSADINGDGRLDLVVRLHRGGRQIINWYENVGGNRFERMPIADAIPFNVRNRMGLRVGDLDGDGDVDIVFAEETSIHWYENLSGTGVFLSLIHI